MNLLSKYFIFDVYFYTFNYDVNNVQIEQIVHVDFNYFMIFSSRPI